MTTHSPPRDPRDEDAWAAEPLPRVVGEVRSTIDGDWLSDAPPLFDVGHDATALFYATNSGVTPCLLRDDDEFRAAQRHIPMGYTDLFLYEKRAVVDGGTLVRLWPQRRTDGDVGDFRVVLPRQGTDRELLLGVPNPLRAAVRTAEDLSGRLKAPVVVARLVSRWGWH